MKILALLIFAVITGNLFAETCFEKKNREDTECRISVKDVSKCGSIIDKLNECNIEKKRNDLNGFQQLLITSSLDGRYF